MVLWSYQNVRPGRAHRVAVIVALVAGAIAPYPSLRSATPATIDSGSAPVSCTETQRAPVTAGAPWRCTALFAPNRSYVMRVDRQQVDVTLELVRPDGKRALKVDSITQRAGPEFLLYRSPTGGKHVLVVDTDETGVPPAVLNVELREMRDTSAGGALSKGLAALTTAATVSNTSDQADAERRIAQLRAALPDLKAPGTRELEAEALLRIAGVNYWVVRDWNSAAAAAQEAIQLFEQVGDANLAAQAAVLRGASLAEIAGTTRRRGARGTDAATHPQFEEAQRLLEGAAKYFHGVGQRYDEANALNNLGLAYYYQGDHDRARPNYLAAARLFSESQEYTSETLPLQNIAVLDYDRGDYLQAAESYQRLLPKLDPEHDRSEYLAILNNLGTVQYVLGDAEAALNTLSRALELTNDGSNFPARARTLHALGRTYLILGEEDRGAVYLEQALELRRSAAAQDRRGLLISLIRIGDLYRDRGDYRRALDLHLEALDRVVSTEERTRVLLAVGLDQMAAGAISAAIETYQRALKLDLADDWPVRISVNGAYGYALLRNGQREGRAMLERAAIAHAASGDDELAARDYYLLASEERRAGDTDAALKSIRTALAFYESQRLLAVNPDLRATYVSSRADAYELQADLYMSTALSVVRSADRAKLQAAALTTAEALRTRALNDFRLLAQSSAKADATPATREILALDNRLASTRHRLGIAMDQTNPSPAIIAALRRELAQLGTELDIAQGKQRAAGTGDLPAITSVSIEQLRLSVAPHAVVLTWLPGEARSWLVLITRESVTALPVASRRDIAHAAQQLYALWSVPGRGDANRNSEVEASRAILGSAGKAIAGKQSVTVVADGALRSIPLGALWVDGGSGERRLAETHVVSYRPSLSRWSAAQNASTGATGKQRILLVGDPVSSSSQAGFSRLPASRREIDSIVRIADGWQSEVLVGEKATKAAVMSEPLGTFRVLHFATHARLDVHDPQLSALVLSGPQAPAASSTSALNLREIVGLGLNADTVVLSACEGSLGKDYRGQLSFGLSEAFLLAGANNVLGSLWRVSDAATERYMQSFYEQYLRRGLAPDAAAQAAARDLMRDPVHGHPFYWAAFVMLSA